MVTGLIAAATAAKWILAGKIMIAVGGGLVTAGPVIDKAVNQRKGKKKDKGVTNNEYFENLKLSIKYSKFAFKG